MMITKQQFDHNMKTSPQQVQQQLKCSNTTNHVHNQQQRCFICFKLVKNLKGNKLSHFYDLNALVNETNFTYSSPQNGETNLKLENNQDVNNNNTNLVNNNTNRIKSGDLFKFKRKQQTIGENILKTLKRTSQLNKSTKIEILLNDNLVYMKKICENCFKQINLIDYHLNNAFKLCDQMSFKLAKSHRLVRTLQRRNSFKKLNGLMKRKATQHDSDLVDIKKNKNGYSQQSRKVGIPTSSSSSSTSSLSSLSVSSNQNGQIKQQKDDLINKNSKFKINNLIKEEPLINNKQEEQEMSSSRRKRKSINPSRLLKEQQSGLESIKTEIFQPQIQLQVNNHHNVEEEDDEVEEDEEEEEEEIDDKLNNIPNFEHKKTDTKAVNNTNNTNNSHKTNNNNNNKTVINTNGKKSLNSNKLAAESLLSLSVLSKLSPTTPPTNIPKTNHKVFNNKTDNLAYNKDMLLNNLLKLNKNPTVAAAQAALIDKLLLNSNNKENDNKLLIKNESDNKQEYVDDNEEQYDETEDHITNGNDYHLEDEDEEEILDEDEEEIEDEEQHINSDEDNEIDNDENENYSDNFMIDYQSGKQSVKQNKSNGFTPTKKQNNQLISKSLKSKKASSSFYSNNLFDENSNQSNKNPNYLQSPRMSISSNGSHLNTKHACEVCKKTFKTQNILRQHMRIHTGDKPFVCEICNKAFSQMASLKYHLATHSDARPYRCETCSKTFKLKPPFKKHIKECQPRHNSNQQQQQQTLSNSPSNASSSSFYYNSNALNMNSSGLDLDLNEDDE